MLSDWGGTASFKNCLEGSFNETEQSVQVTRVFHKPRHLLSALNPTFKRIYLAISFLNSSIILVVLLIFFPPPCENIRGRGRENERVLVMNNDVCVSF